MRLIRVLLITLSAAWFVQAQPTFNILSRTLRVQSRYGTGTIFNIDIDGREYWVSAAHIVTGARESPMAACPPRPLISKFSIPGELAYSGYP